ncbi:MAG: hypothetical protein ACK4WC_11365 [Rubrimonas sp.]
MLAQGRQARSFLAVGSPSVVRDRLRAIVAAFHRDELIVTAMIHDTAAQARSAQIAAEALAGLRDEAAAG